VSTDVTPTSPARSPSEIEAAIEAVRDTSLRIEDRAALYAVLHQIQLRIRRALGLLGRRGMESTPSSEIISHMEANHLAELGPLRLKVASQDVHYGVNDEGNWTDFTVQDYLRDVVMVMAPEFVKVVPQHFEIRTKELGEAVHGRDPVALQLWRELNERGLRTVEAKRLSLEVREP
jgi:hypothetical protein